MSDERNPVAVIRLGMTQMQTAIMILLALSVAVLVIVLAIFFGRYFPKQRAADKMIWATKERFAQIDKADPKALTKHLLLAATLARDQTIASLVSADPLPIQAKAAGDFIDQIDAFLKEYGNDDGTTSRGDRGALHPAGPDAGRTHQQLPEPQ